METQSSSEIFVPICQSTRCNPRKVESAPSPLWEPHFSLICVHVIYVLCFFETNWFHP